LKPDPLGMVNGPNLYAYCGNNPINFLDPWGLVWPVGWKGWTGAVALGLGGVVLVATTAPVWVGVAIGGVGVALITWDVKDNWDTWSGLFEDIWKKTRVDPLEDLMDDLFGEDSSKTNECDDGPPTNSDESQTDVGWC
jgi:hypothetical protein